MNQMFRTIILITLTLFPYLSITGPALAQTRDETAFTHPTKVHNVTQGHTPRIAAESDTNLNIAFEGGDTKAHDVFYVRSGDGGLTWTAPLNISRTTGASSHPDIALERTGALDVVWADTRSEETSPDIFFARSEDKGKTWTPPTNISNTPGASAEPAMATGPDGSIHVVWTDTSKGEKNKDVFYSASTDGGKTWAKDPLLPAEDISNTPGKSIEPAIAVDQDGIPHACWLDSTPGETHPDIYYVYKENNSWTKPVNVSHSPRISDHPTIGCGAKGKFYVGWQDYSQKPTAPDIWCAPGGKSGKFEKPINISDTPGVSGEPTLATDQAGRLAFVWTDTSKTFKKPDIFARISNDGANDFTTVMDISNTPGISKHPDVVIAGNHMIVTWEEIEGNISALKLTSMSLENLATGPPREVNPSIHGKSSNCR